MEFIRKYVFHFLWTLRLGKVGKKYLSEMYFIKCLVDDQLKEGILILKVNPQAPNLKRKTFPKN